MPADVIIYMNALWWSACQPKLNNSRLKCGRAARSHKLSRNQQYIHRTRGSCTVCAITSICARQWEPCVHRIERDKKKATKRIKSEGGGWKITTNKCTSKIGLKLYLLDKWEHSTDTLFSAHWNVCNKVEQTFQKILPCPSCFPYFFSLFVFIAVYRVSFLRQVICWNGLRRELTAMLCWDFGW